MGGPRHRSALAVVVALVCVAVCGALGMRPALAAPVSFSPPSDTHMQGAHRAVVARAETTQPPHGLATHSNVTAAALPSGTWAPVGPSPIAGNVQDPSQSGGQYGDVSGRITALVTDPMHAATVFAGAADGGVWKSTNGGTSWTPLTDSQQTLAIGSLAIDSTGQIIYAGTGEVNGSQDSQLGEGVLKSTDGGGTWTLQGNSTFAGLHIGSIAIDSQVSNAQRVLAATDAGLYISTNGGSTWTRNTNIDSVIFHLATFDHSVFEIHQDPAVASRFFATVGDFCNNEQGQVLVSADSGSTWSNSDSLTDPHSCSLRVALGAGRNNTEYAAWSDINGDLLQVRRSTNGGASWTTVMGASTSSYFDVAGSPQAWYDNVIAVDPTDANRAVFGGVTVLNTTDGGATFTDVGHVYDAQAGLHPDFHAIAFTGANTLYIGNDGGVWHSTTLGGTSGPSWTDVNANLEITQFYNGSALDVSTLIGGAQDVGDPGRLPTSPPSPHWQQYGVGDGTGTAIKPGSNGNNFYISVPQAGILQQTSALSGGIEANPTIAAPCNFGPNPAQGTACNDPAAFVAPFVMDPADGNKLFAATNHVYRSTSGGLPAGNGGWTQTSSQDLTSGTSNFTGSSDVINAMSMTPGTNTVVTGAALSGTAFETTDGSTWVNISGSGSTKLPQPNSSTFGFLGATGWITSVAINPTNSHEVWVTIGDSIGTGTVWHTTTAGSTNVWADLSSGGTAPITGPVNSIVEDPATPTTLYVGTATGVYTCTGCGGSSPTPVWSTAGTGMPAVFVSGVTISSDDTTLVAWSHGRGAWELPLTGGGTPVANLQPASVSFGLTAFGTSAPTQTVTMSNWGDATLSPTASLSGPNAGDFFVQSDTCSGSSMSPNTSCTVTVGCTPTHIGALSASLQFADGADGSPQSVGLSASGSPQPIRATTTQQYFMHGSDGTTWQAMDPSNLSLTFLPLADETALFTANADLWTFDAGFNQDIGIAVNGTVIAWKESGGFAGTFSPNAAAVQGSFAAAADTTYTVQIVWKTNKPMPSGDEIAAGAGHTGDFSPTTLQGLLVPTGSGFQAQSSTDQFLLSSSDGQTWASQDSSSNQLPSVSITPASNSEVLLSANADLWTFSAGFNQDIGIQVTPSGGSPTVVAWKESGGFAGIFSPNAAFVQALVPMTGGTQYTVQLVWKSNKPLTGGAQIAAGAGPISGLFSPTDVFAVVDPVTGGPQSASSSTQYFLTGSDGVAWNTVDAAHLQLPISPSSTCEARITANADLWTFNAGLNQDIGIQVDGSVIAWKESGGFAGTFSPNAAFVQGVALLTAGPHTVTLVWKSNIGMSAGQQIAMAAGPWPEHTATFSPTTIAVDLHC